LASGGAITGLVAVIANGGRSQTLVPAVITIWLILAVTGLGTMLVRKYRSRDTNNHRTAANAAAKAAARKRHSATARCWNSLTASGSGYFRRRTTGSARVDDRFSARRGTYRVIYRINDKAHVVTVVDIGHRRDIYPDLTARRNTPTAE
jgi:ParE toxin of type II toxin-antitoxin system, parDE